MNNFTERYSRQLILKNWSLEKQQRLAQLTVAVPSQLPCTALYLAAAGIGRLVFCGNGNWNAHIRNLNPNVVVVDSELDNEKIDINIELSQETSLSTNVETYSDLPMKLVVYCDDSDTLYAASMASCKVISLVHFDEI